MPNFVSFVVSVAELAHGKKSRTKSVTQPFYLMPWELKHLCFGTDSDAVVESCLLTRCDLGVYGCFVRTLTVQWKSLEKTMIKALVK